MIPFRGTRRHHRVHYIVHNDVGEEINVNNPTTVALPISETQTRRSNNSGSPMASLTENLIYNKKSKKNSQNLMHVDVTRTGKE